MIKSLKYKNSEIQPSKNFNIIVGGNGSGKSVMLSGIYQYLKTGQSELISDVEVSRAIDDYRVFYMKQGDLIQNKKKIEELVKEHTNFYKIQANIAQSLKNLRIEDNEESIFKLNVLNDQVRNNIEKFKEHKKLLQEKESIENYMKGRESRKLCKKIIEIQDKIAQEEIVADNFENEVNLIKKEQHEKEIADLKHQISNEHELIERKKILWREEAKLKENIKKYRNDRRVIDLIEIEEEITDAVIAVLGNRLKAKVVQYENEAIEEIKTLKYRQTYLIMEKLHVPNKNEENLPDGMIPMKKFIKTKAEFNKLKEFLFQDIFIVENINMYDSNKILVTPTGQILHKNGAITGGYEENKELKYMLKEKDNYKKSIARLKEIEKELKKVADSSVSDTKNLINKIIADKENELKKITISKNNINFNLEKLKIFLNRLIDQKRSLNLKFEDSEMNEEFENKNLYEELGRLNKEIKTIMINRKIDYEDIGNRIDELVERNIELEKQKSKMLKIAEDLEIENNSTIERNFGAISERISYFYNQINGSEFEINETDSSECKLLDSLSDKENFQNIYKKSLSIDEPNVLLQKIPFLSGGQLQMLTLACMFAIHEIVNFDVILLDEIDSNLDTSKINNLNSLFRDLHAQVFQISHRSDIFEAEKYFSVTTETVQEINHTGNL